MSVDKEVSKLAKQYGAVVYENNKLWMHGGTITAVQYANSLLSLTLTTATPQWHLHCSGEGGQKAPQMAGHSMSYYAQQLVVLGGRNSFTTFADCIIFHLPSSLW